MPISDDRVRAARPGDAQELLRLRVAVLAGEAVTDAWRISFQADMQQRLGADPSLRAFVAPAPDGTLAACAIGCVYRGYTGPTYPQGRWGRIFTVVTDPAWRRQGLGRAVTAALAQSMTEEGCSSIELRATDEGAALYRQMGFTAIDGPYMTLRPPESK
ncbi:GNAT family N-acetyltransferase [Streptacidiphilus sp. EB103A]|uniref:GNAT family N-acetyltransferase n=1 Tax=Streptacidiphilus sp. EB103A TaxID=3156275 RepID=UPI0035141271